MNGHFYWTLSWSGDGPHRWHLKGLTVNGHCHLAVNTKPMNIQQRYIRLMQDGSSVLLALAYRQIPFPATKNRGRHLDAKSIVA